MRYHFLIHTPLQLFVGEQMLRSMDKFNAHNTLFYLEGNEVDYHPSNDQSINYHCLPIEPFWRYKPDASGRMKQYLELLKANVQEGDVILLSDLHWFQNNMIFFDPILKQKCHFHLYDEGIGIYTTEMVGLKQIAKDCIKIALSHTGLFPIIRAPYLGNIMGIDHPRIEHVYAFQPDQITSWKKCITKIPSPVTPEHPLDADKILFLDQHYWFNTKGGDGLWERFHNDTIAQLSEIAQGKELCVKMHHIRREREEEAYKKAGFEIVEDARPIEAILYEHGFGQIISYCSSALVNCKRFYPDVKTTSIQLRQMHEVGYLTPKQYNNVLDIYRANGVEIL